jgi:transposase
VRAAHPTAEVAVWAMDEHRVGLQPVLRRVWAPKGQRPVAVVRPRYQWTYLYGFARPATGDTYWLLLPVVSGAAFSAALREFARATGAGPEKRVVLVLDGAGWHSGKAVAIPEGLHLVPLPPYSPELQPVERLWPLTDEALANRPFADLDALERAQAARCLTLREQRDVVRATTRFHWWTEAA